MNVYAAGTLVLSEECQKSEEYQIGKMVIAIQKAMEHPEARDSLETIVHYGQDLRYYNMIRGWLGFELSGVVSQYEATGDESIREKRVLKIEFLKKAIREIDME